MPKVNRSGDVELKERTKTKKPPKYKVIIHNDDYTPQDFVVMILMEIFKKSRPSAVQIMLSVHNKGQGLAGVYTREIAESKMNKVHTIAESYQHPLRCSIEPE